MARALGVSAIGVVDPVERAMGKIVAEHGVVGLQSVRRFQRKVADVGNEKAARGGGLDDRGGDIVVDPPQIVRQRMAWGQRGAADFGVILPGGVAQAIRVDVVAKRTRSQLMKLSPSISTAP